MARQIRRLVAGHNAAGRSAFIYDGPPPTQIDTPEVSGTLVWVTDQTPASNAGRADAADRPFLDTPAPANGTAFYVFEYPPKSSEPVDKGEGQYAGMHTTKTVDYIVMLSGQITCILEDGEATLSPGDVLVDRGVAHAWENRGTEPAIMASIVIDAKPL